VIRFQYGSPPSEYLIDGVTNTGGNPVVRVWLVTKNEAGEEVGSHVGDVSAGTVVSMSRKAATPK
jgi:hypothetical protein